MIQLTRPPSISLDESVRGTDTIARTLRKYHVRRCGSCAPHLSQHSDRRQRRARRARRARASALDFGRGRLHRALRRRHAERCRPRLGDSSHRDRRRSSTRSGAVLTTAVVASLGFLPMALATGAGSEVQRPLASVVMGGLVTATILTLGLLPTLYAATRERRSKQEPIAESLIEEVVT